MYRRRGRRAAPPSEWGNAAIEGTCKQERLRMIERAEHSAVSVKAFCQGEGVSAQNFYA